MKKLWSLLLLTFVLFMFLGQSVQASMRLFVDTRETTFVDGVRHTKIVGQLEYDGVTSNQVINYMGANVLQYPDLNIAVGDNYKAHDSWGRGTIIAHAEDIQERYPNYEVIGGVNGDFYNTSITNLNGQPSGGYIRNFEVIAPGVVATRPLAGFKDDGTAVFGVPCYTGYQLLVYDEDGALKKEVAIERINNLPTANDKVTVYFDNYDTPLTSAHNKVVIKAKETKMDGVRYFGSGAFLSQTSGEMSVQDHHFVLVGTGFNDDNLITPVDYVVVQRKIGCGFEDVRFAVGVYDELVKDGVPVTYLEKGLDPAFKHPRTAIGQKADGTIFFVVVDGRNKPLGMDGVNLYELAQIMVYFEAVRAYNIDGGGSSTMAIKDGEGSFDILNTPSDGTVRAVTNGVFIVKGEPLKLKPNALFLGVLPKATTQADDTDGLYDIISHIKRELPQVKTKAMPINPSDEDIKIALKEAEGVDQILMTSYNANVYGSQIKLIDALHGLGKEVHVIAMRNPYDLFYTNRIQHFVCLYEYTPNSIRVLMAYLKGELQLEGRIPVVYA